MAADILIIDDEADIRGLIAGILEDEGFETRLAHNSDAALGEISQRRPSLRWPCAYQKRHIAAQSAIDCSASCGRSDQTIAARILWISAFRRWVHSSWLVPRHSS